MKVLDVALKDLLRNFRSLFAVGMMFIAPLLITGLIFMAFGGLGSGDNDMNAIRVALVNHDPGMTLSDGSLLNMGDNLVKMFNDESVSGWIVALDAGEDSDAVEMVNQRQAGVAVIIPEEFSRVIIEGKNTVNVRVIHDPTLTIGPAVVRDMIGSLVNGVTGARILLETQADLTAQAGTGEIPDQLTSLAEYEAWFMDFNTTLFHSPEAAVVIKAPSAGEGISGGKTEIQQILALTLAGQMIFFGFYTGAYSMMSILREQEEGTLARLFTTPTNRTYILGGKFLAVLLMVIVQALVMLAAGVFLFKIDWGNPATIALAITGQVVAATGLGVLLIGFVKTTDQAGPIIGGGLTAMAALGGLFFANIPNMPAFFNTISKFTPQGWVLDGWKLTLSGAQPAAVLLPVLVSLIMGVGMLAIGTVQFRRRLA